MSKITDIVSTLAKPEAERLGLALWDVEFVREGPHWILRVSIDHPDGVSTDMCEAMSRALDPLLDEADPIEQSYILEVASAGLERTLKRDSDFQQFLGHPVELHFYTPQNRSKELLGKLTAHDGQRITVLSDSGEQSFSMKDVAGVRLRLT